MGFYDNSAFQATQMGHDASEFEAAAQKHANATWSFLAITAIVWYFASWMWALIPFGLAVVSAVKSISATRIAQRIAKRGG